MLIAVRRGQRLKIETAVFLDQAVAVGLPRSVRTHGDPVPALQVSAHRLGDLGTEILPRRESVAHMRIEDAVTELLNPRQVLVLGRVRPQRIVVKHKDQPGDASLTRRAVLQFSDRSMPAGRYEPVPPSQDTDVDVGRPHVVQASIDWPLLARGVRLHGDVVQAHPLQGKPDRITAILEILVSRGDVNPGRAC
jgi:hypothetical protein